MIPKLDQFSFVTTRIRITYNYLTESNPPQTDENFPMRLFPQRPHPKSEWRIQQSLNKLKLSKKKKPPTFDSTLRIPGSLKIASVHSTTHWLPPLSLNFFKKLTYCHGLFAYTTSPFLKLIWVKDFISATTKKIYVSYKR